MKVHGTVEFTREEAQEVITLESKRYELRQELLADIKAYEEHVENTPTVLFSEDPDKEPENIMANAIVVKLQDLNQKGIELERQRNLLKQNGKLPDNW